MSNKRKHYLLQPTNFFLKTKSSVKVQIKLIKEGFPVSESKTHKFKVIVINHEPELETKFKKAAEVFDYYESNGLEVKGENFKCLVKVQKKVEKNKDIYEIAEETEEDVLGTTSERAEIDVNEKETNEIKSKIQELINENEALQLKLKLGNVLMRRQKRFDDERRR